ncbi:hypothetical protein BJ508DRAFT_307640 [Ascobolus immersus RN42]|uniref:Uncharacterized protein n=1 Tax=Ascobolus immersus RN42 TaxID=1160509 RepID=A0A3N4I4D8_ASCIM|nr:hypothetical protein BJ508DRAFT_307640 [Ascobolus immersus RN42]
MQLTETVTFSLYWLDSVYYRFGNWVRPPLCGLNLKSLFEKHSSFDIEVAAHTLLDWRRGHPLPLPVPFSKLQETIRLEKARDSHMRTGKKECGREDDVDHDIAAEDLRRIDVRRNRELAAKESALDGKQGDVGVRNQQGENGGMEGGAREVRLESASTATRVLGIREQRLIANMELVLRRVVELLNAPEEVQSISAVLDSGGVVTISREGLDDNMLGLLGGFWGFLGKGKAE